MNCRSTISAILTLTLLLPGHLLPSQGQQYTLHELPTQQFLPVANVHCIFLDNEGYMWYGTIGGGLCRDNGYQIDVFRSDKNHAAWQINNDITCIAEDASYNIWFGTRAGLFRLNKHNYTISQPLNKQISKQAVDHILSDRQKQLWISAGGKVYRIGTDGLLKAEYTLKTKNACRLYEDSRQQLWATEWEGGLLKYNRQTKTFERAKWPLAVHPINIVEDEKNFWVSTWGHGIVRYHPSTGSVIPQPPTMGSKEKRQVIDMEADHTQGFLWVTTMNDLYLYRCQDSSLQPVRTESFVPGGFKILDQITEDKEGNIWVAGFMPHTFILAPYNNRLKRYPVPAMQQLSGYPLLADKIAGVKDNYFWIWQGRKGLTLYHADSERLAEAGGIAYHRCIEKCQGDDSGIWAAKGKTLMKLTHDGMAVKEEIMKEMPESISTIADYGTGQLLIGTDKGLYIYTIFGKKLKKLCDAESQVIDAAAAPGNTYYYIAAGKGLFKIKGREKGRLNKDAEDFTSIALSGNGTLWAGTRQGLVYSLMPGDTQLVADNRISNANGDAVICVETDALGHIWVVSDQSIKEIDPQTHAFQIIRNSDPFVQVSYFYNVVPLDDNHVIINGAGAFCIAESSPELNKSAYAQVRPAVTSLVFNDSTKFIGIGERDVEISSNETEVVVRFSTFDHLHAHRISYAYLLKGWNNDWIYLPQGINYARLTNLPKGKYTLLVKATDSQGCWSKATEVLTIHRMRAWHETWWAYLLFILAASALAYGLWQLNKRIRILRLLQKRRQALSLSEIEITPEETRSGRLDEQFLKQAIRLIEEHISDSGYNVKQFSCDMCMSRMNLYRKLQLMTGQSPTGFIRDIRLKKAAQLLKSCPHASIADIVERVGFATPSYFSKCFKAKFGMLPKEYAGQHKK